MIVTYLQVSVGRMVFNKKLQRGVQDCSFIPIKVAIHRDSSRDHVLAKTVSSVYSDAPSGSLFYLADGSGHTIMDADFTIDYPDGTKESLPWSLRNYLRVSCIKFPSRTRLYCVATFPGED